MFKRIARVVARVVKKMVQVADRPTNKYEEIFARFARDIAREYGARA